MPRNFSRLIGILVALAIVGLIGWQLVTNYLNEREWESGRQQGEAALEMGDLAGAELKLEQSLEAARKLGDQDPRIDDSLVRLGDVREAQGKFNDTESLYLHSMQQRIARFGTISKPVAEVQTKLGHVYLLQGELPQAEGTFNTAIDTYDQVGALDSLDAVPAHLGLARTMAAQDRFDQAEASFRRALQIQKAAPESDKIQLGITYRGLAAVLEKRGQTGEAAALLEQSRSLAVVETPPTATVAAIASPTVAAVESPSAIAPGAAGAGSAPQAPTTAEPLPTSAAPAG